MKLSILMPVYNEEKTIRQILRRVLDVSLPGIEKEIVIVDDCSGDNTREILGKINDKRVRVFYHEINKGKGTAIRTALGEATGDLIIVQDADLEYDPEDYRNVLKPIIDGKADVVYGSRIDVIKKNLDKMYKLHYLGNVFLTLVTNILYGSKITDMETCYKAFKRDVIKGMKLRARRFDFEPEITAKILKKGHRIKEVPISFHGRKFDEGKKITWRDGIKAVYYLVKYRFID